MLSSFSAAVSCLYCYMSRLTVSLSRRQPTKAGLLYEDNSNVRTSVIKRFRAVFIAERDMFCYDDHVNGQNPSRESGRREPVDFLTPTTSCHT